MTDFDKIWEDIVKGLVSCPVCRKVGDTNEPCPFSDDHTMGNCDRRRNAEKHERTKKRRTGRLGRELNERRGLRTWLSRRSR